MPKRKPNTLEAAGDEPLLYLTAEGCHDLDIQAAEKDGEGKPKGPRSFSMTGYSGGPMNVGFGLPVVVDLAGLSISNKSRPILRDHNTSQIVGHTDVISNDGRRIKLTGKLSGSNAHAAEIESSASAGFPWQASIGASIERMLRLDEGESMQVNGRKVTGPALVARKSQLREVSFVALGADDNTSARLAASFSAGSITMKFEAWLKFNGWTDYETLSEKQKATIKAAYDAELKAAGGDGDDKPDDKPAVKKTIKAKADDPAGDDGDLPDAEQLKAAYRQEIAAERVRIKAIEAKATEYESDKAEEIAAKAIAENWTAEKAELHLLRASREAAPAPAGHVHGKEKDGTVQAMQGALMLRAGCSFEDRAFQGQAAQAMELPKWLRAGVNAEQKQKAMEAAHQYSDMSLFDLCCEAVRIDGNYVGSTRSRARIMQAAFSGSSLTDIFTTSVNAALLASYMQSMDTTAGWVSERDVADFKLNERLRLTKGGGLRKLPRGTTAEHRDRADSKESYKLARYADQFVVDEQDIIDDSMNAFSDIAPDMGQAAARLRPDLVYAILLANAVLATDSVALFDENTHLNDKTSAALSALTLKAAIAALEKQRENGVNLNLRATHLIVPSDLKHLAAQLIRSAETRNVGDGTSGDNAEFGTENTLRTIETMSLVSDSRLANGVTDPATEVTHAGSATEWYIASSMGHTIEVGYLRGTGRAPQVRSFALDKGTWGVGWDVKHDIGAKALDYRAMQRRA